VSLAEKDMKRMTRVNRKRELWKKREEKRKREI
jgi:hypothetical protein